MLISVLAFFHKSYGKRQGYVGGLFVNIVMIAGLHKVNAFR